MSGGFARTCAMASAFLALAFSLAVTFGAFSPPAHPGGGGAHVAGR